MAMIQMSNTLRIAKTLDVVHEDVDDTTRNRSKNADIIIFATPVNATIRVDGKIKKLAIKEECNCNGYRKYKIVNYAKS